MADSRWRVGGLTSTITFAKTDAQIADVLNWFALDKVGDPPPELTTQAQINQWRLDQAHREAMNYIQREANRNRLRTLREQANLEEQAEQETRL